VELLNTAITELEGLDHSRWDKGDDNHHDKDEDARQARRLRQDGHVAGVLLVKLPEWRKHYAKARAGLAELERNLRTMDSSAGYIVEGFEYEARRGGLIDKYELYCPLPLLALHRRFALTDHKLPPRYSTVDDVLFHVDSLKSEKLPFATALLNRMSNPPSYCPGTVLFLPSHAAVTTRLIFRTGTSTATALLDSGEAEVAALIAALTDIRDASVSQPPRLVRSLLARLRRLQQALGANEDTKTPCELGDIFWSRLKMVEARDALSNRLMDRSDYDDAQARYRESRKRADEAWDKAFRQMLEKKRAKLRKRGQ
jgi:hypothetical protein